MRSSRLALELAAVALIATVALPAESIAQTDEHVTRRIRIVPDDGRQYENFGAGTAIQGDEAFIGSGFHAYSLGAVYVYRRVGAQWVEQQLLEPSDGRYLTWFGITLAVHGDILAVGAPGVPDYGYGAGTVYVFRRTPDGWVEEDKLSAPDGFINDLFGSALAVHDGTIVAGGRLEAAYVYRHDGNEWIFEQRLESSDGVSGDEFGLELALENETMVVGAQGRGGTGAAYFFEWTEESWVERQILEASEGQSGDLFGAALALQGDTLAIGAHRDDDGADDLGSVYIFERSNGNWTELDELKPNDTEIDMSFGLHVDFDGNYLISGTEMEVAYVFRHDAGGWVQDHRLDSGRYPLTFYDIRFGWPVAADDGVVLVGATWDDENGELAGAAYIFESDERPPGLAETKLLPADGEELDGFGNPVILDGDDLVVGACCSGDAGAVYFLRQDDLGQIVEYKLVPEDGEPDDFFGLAISISGDTLAVGAQGDDDAGAESGAVYVFRRNGDGWEQRAKLTPPDAVAGERFGSAVALDADTLAVGAEDDDDQGEDSGSVYVFRGGDSDWALEAKLIPAEVGAGHTFGRALALAGDTLAASAPFYRVYRVQGAVYTYRRAGSDWGEPHRLRPDTLAESFFGYSLSMDGDELVVGAPVDHGNGLWDGAVYVYANSGASWALQQKLSAGLGSPDDFFGRSVRLLDDTIIVGAPYDDDAILDSGSVYEFRRQESSWVEYRRLTAGDPGSRDNYGRSVDTDGNKILVGAPWDDDNGSASGSVYLYRSASPPVADAGVDTQSECASPAGAVVTLDGSGSSDPDDDIVLFEWFTDFGLPTRTLIGEGEIVDAALPLGGNTVTLRVTDSTGQTDTDEVLKSVVDTTPPQLDVSLSPDILWPPNHRMVDVAASVASTDLCGPTTVTLVSIGSSEADDAPGRADGETSDDVQGAEFGTPDFEFSLRAERDGTGTGRTYSVVYNAVDLAGHSAAATAEVRVPHDRNGGTEPILITIAVFEEGTEVSWTESEDALHYRLIRRRLSSITENESAINLGAGSCLLTGSVTATAVVQDELDTPPPGEVFLYMVEYEDADGTSSFGTESAAKPRVTTTGNCH